MTNAQIEELAKVTCPACGARVGIFWGLGTYAPPPSAWRYARHFRTYVPDVGPNRRMLCGTSESRVAELANSRKRKVPVF